VTLNLELQTLSEKRKRIVSETTWMLSELKDYRRKNDESDPNFMRAHSLVVALDAAAQCPLPLQSDTAGVAIAGRKFLESVKPTILPIGIFIQEMNAVGAENQLVMLLMAGMTVILSTFEAIYDRNQEVAASANDDELDFGTPP
jgi:hypothetical protein